MNSTDRERIAEQALLAEHVARQASNLGHACHLKTMAERRRDGLIADLAIAMDVSATRLHEVVALHATSIAVTTMRMSEAAALIANLQPTVEEQEANQ